MQQLQSHGLLKTSEYVCLPSAHPTESNFLLRFSIFFFFLHKTDEVTKESRTPTHTICLCLQEGDTSGGPLSSRRHEQLLHCSAQRRHQPLHHQVVKYWKPWSCWKLKQKSNSGLLTLKQSGFPSRRDLAAAVDRMQEYHFHEMIYVVRQQSTLRISIEIWELITCVSSGWKKQPMF